MKFKKIKFKGKKRAGLAPDAVPLIELNRCSRLSESQVDADYEWHSASTRHKGEPRTTERRRDELLSFLFPPHLGTIATAWRIQIETAQNPNMFPISPEVCILKPRPVYRDTARPRVRVDGREKSARAKGKGKGTVRFVFKEDSGCGEGSSSRAL